jgi:hypothetical protein
MSTNETIIIPPQAGMAPIDPDQPKGERATEERERTHDCPDLLTYLKRTCDSIEKQRDAEWQAILNQQATCVAFFDDRQYGTAKDGVFVDAKREPGDVRPIDNWYKIHIEKLMTEFARAFPDIQVKAADRNDSKKVEAAKFAQARVNYNRKQQLRAGDRQREAQALLLKSITWRYVYHSEGAEDAPVERRARKSKRQYGQTRSIITCKLCGGPMKRGAAPEGESEGATDDYKCVNCGSNRQKVIEIGGREAEVVDGYDEVRGGCIETRHVDPTMVRVSLKTRRSVRDSSFLWYHQTIERHILEAAYADVKIKGSRAGTQSNADRYARDAEGAPSNAVGGSWAQADTGGEPEDQGGDQFEECPYDLFWLDVSVYKNKKFPKEQRLRGGRVIPANTPLGQFFTNGMCVVKNADQIIDMYPENKNKKWLFCVYGIREHALHGSGTNNLIGPQITRNDLKAYLIANNYYNASAREFIRDGCFTGNRLPALNEAAVVKEVPDDKPMLGWAYEKAIGTPLPEQSLQLYQAEAGSMQEGAGTSSLSSEGTSVDKALGTATGVAAMRDQAVGRMGPNLMLWTEMEVDWCYLTLEHELRYFSDERFMKMANQAITADQTDGSVTYGLDGIRAFMECDPRTDFEIDAVPGSWMPRRDVDRQASFGAFMTMVSDLFSKMPNHPLTQELMALGAQIWGVTEIDFAGWTSTEQVAQARIRAFAKTVETYRKRNVRLPLEDLVQEIITRTPDAMIDNEMDNHALFMTFYENWWASDEGRTCPMLLKAVIKTQHVLHRAGVVEKAQKLAQDQIESERPKAEAAAAMAAAGGGGGNKEPSVSLPYKEAPEDIRRQIEADAGYTPSQMGAPPAEGEGESGADETAKAQTALALQQHKAEIDKEADERKAQLEVDKKAATTQLDEQRAEADHSRALELEGVKQQHQVGIEGAKLSHLSTEKQKDREAQRNKPAKK